VALSKITKQSSPPQKRRPRAAGNTPEPLDSRLRGNDGTAAIENPAAIREAIRERALSLGFDAVGFAAARLGDDARAHLEEFVARGWYGDMGWLAATAERRGDPRALWAEARTVVVLGVNYAPEDDPLTLAADPAAGMVSVYARGRDYHDTLKRRLKALARWVDAQWPGALKLFVDTAPVMEKPLAQQAGIGWQGKHTNLVARSFGSWLFLGEIYLSLELEPDPPETDHCGSCRRCLEICPTAAFPAPHRLDARRCISYLTIEHKGMIPVELRRLIGNRIYGCDDCLAVCPWNKFAQAASEADFLPRAELTAPRLAALAALDDPGFRRMFAGSPVKRIGRARFLRNVLVAIGNAGPGNAGPSNAGPGDVGPGIAGAESVELLAAARRCLDDEAALVRAAAVWAFSRLSPRAFGAERGLRLAAEHDPLVRAEWERVAEAG
jgi:epoxyqueuosine reductase